MIKRLIPLLMTGYALWQWNRRRQQRTQASEGENSLAKPAAESRWEGEGGALRSGPRQPTA